MPKVLCTGWRVRVTGLLLAWLAAVAPCRAVVDGQSAPLSDRRLDAVGLLLTVQPWNACGGWISGSCTLVAPNTVLIAKHSVQRSDQTLPPDGQRTHRVRFRRAADGAVNNHFDGNSGNCPGDYQEIYISRFIASPFAGVDMALGILESNPIGITPIGVDVDFAFAPGTSVMLAGWGYSGRCIQTGDAWTLRTDQGALPVQRLPSTYVFEYNQVTFTGSCLNAQPAGTPHWVVGNIHDSGAPILIETPSLVDPSRVDLRVVGVVTSFTSAQRVSAWNLAGGQPPLENPRIANGCAEFDGNPGVTINDVFAYINAWVVADPRANIDGQPDVTLSDLLTFVQRFLGGC